MNETRELEGIRVGLVGLGLMGKPMGRLLVGAGAELVVANRSAAAIEEMVRAGAKCANSAAELAESLDGGVILLMLKDAEAVIEMSAGSGGILEKIRPGTVVVDMGTTSLAATRRLAEELGKRGCSLLDAPVSGGEKGAVEGTLSVMVGGRSVDFERVFPIFNTLGKRVTLMGPSGSGQVTKLANQMIVAATIDAVAEALQMAEAAGVDPGAVRDALRGGFAESRILDVHGERMVSGDFVPGGKATGQVKDLIYARELADDLKLELPGLAAQVILWERMIEAGMGDLDHSGLHAFLRAINKRPR